MARSDWAALITDPAAEYLAQSELSRFGMTPYLPQQRKRHHIRSGKYVMRSYPLFPRYILIPYNDAHDPNVRLARGICRQKPILSGDDGRPWRAPDKVIEKLRAGEEAGLYDDFLHRGDHVTVAHSALAAVRSVLSSDTTTGMIELLTPLFGGARAMVDGDKLMRAV